MKFSCLSAGCAITPHLEVDEGATKAESAASPAHESLTPLAAAFLFGAAPKERRIPRSAPRSWRAAGA